MKGKINKRWPILTGLSVFVVFYASQSIFNLSLYGILDALAVSLVLLAITLLVSSFPKALGITSVFLLAALVFGLSVADLFYFSFYQSYIPFSLTVMLSDSASLLEALPGYLFVVIGVVATVLLSCSWGVATVFGFLKRRTIFLISIILCLSGSWLFYTHDQRNLKNFSRFHETPFGYFLRSAEAIPFIVGSPLRQRTERIEAEALALEGRMNWELPERYSSTFGYFRPDQVIENANFPLTRNYQSDEAPKNYNVLVIVMESLRASEMGLYGNSETATPFLDQLATEDSVSWAKEFYSTAALTIKSEVAINCGVMDFYGTEPASKKGVGARSSCLPRILGREGYETLWFHGNDTKFYNRNFFHPTMGFSSLYGIDQLYGLEYENIPRDHFGDKQSSERPMLGWGIPDEKLYDLALDKLEGESKPFYAEIMTTSNHLPFNYDWGIPFPDYLQSEDTFYQRYRRGTYYSDYALSKFFRRFKNSSLSENTIVVITGDHGVWTFDDRVEYSELAKQVMFFQTPLLIYVPNSNGQLMERAGSHLDIAPTLIDLLGIGGEFAFLGDSLLKREVEGRLPIYLMLDSGYGVRMEDKICIPQGRCFVNGPECKTWEEDYHLEQQLSCFEAGKLLGDYNDLPAAHISQEELRNVDLLLDYVNVGLHVGFLPSQ